MSDAVNVHNEIKHTQPRKEWVYVSIPTEGILDNNVPTFCIGRYEFAPGKHLVPQDIAETLADRINAWWKAQIKIFQPHQDMGALRDLYKGSAIIQKMSSSAPEFRKPE
jgi:hypothetical protein